MQTQTTTHPGCTWVIPYLTSCTWGVLAGTSYLQYCTWVIPCQCQWRDLPSGTILFHICLLYLYLYLYLYHTLSFAQEECWLGLASQHAHVHICLLLLQQLANYTTHHTPILTVLRTHTYPPPIPVAFSAKTVIFKTVHLIEPYGVQLYYAQIWNFDTFSRKGYPLVFGLTSHRHSHWVHCAAWWCTHHLRAPREKADERKVGTWKNLRGKNLRGSGCEIITIVIFVLHTSSVIITCPFCHHHHHPDLMSEGFRSIGQGSSVSKRNDPATN